jgi:hypothetical protein
MDFDSLAVGTQPEGPLIELALPWLRDRCRILSKVLDGSSIVSSTARTVL